MSTVTTRIADAMQSVSRLRDSRSSDPLLNQATLEVKRFQAQRFSASYADVLCDSRYRRAAEFFLHELYGDKDYEQRDQQFSRIAGTISRIFPRAVAETAAALAEVHALTEQLDDQMAHRWLISTLGPETRRYVDCWRRVGDRAARHQQLQVVLQLGRELDRLTRMPGLRGLLKMMRKPAAAAGLSSLQVFLEAGFDAFAEMKGSGEFLALIEKREMVWIDALFEGEAVASETKLNQLLADSPPH